MLQPVNCDGTGKTVNLIKLMNHNSILHEGCSCKTLLHSLRERRLNWVELVSWLVGWASVAQKTWRNQSTDGRRWREGDAGRECCNNKGDSGRVGY